MPSVLEVAQALADALTDVSPAQDIIVSEFMVFAPGGACLDIYPANVAESNQAFGYGERIHWFTIRLRVTADSESSQAFLYNARNATGAESVREALNDSTSTGGALETLAEALVIADDSPSGFQLYEDAPGSGVLRFVGEEWRVGVYVGEDGAT